MSFHYQGCDVFTAHFIDCHFDENVFLPLGGDKPKEWLDITWYVPSLSHLDPCTRQCELEIQRIVHLQGLANQLPDVFTDIKKVTKSHVPVVNASTRIDVPEGQLENVIANESKTRLKHGRPIGSKDLIPRKRKGTTYEKLSTPEEFTNMKWSNDETQLDKQLASEEAQIDQIPVSRIEEISMSHMGETKDRSDIIIDNIFAFQVAMDIMRNDEYQEPQTMNERRKMKDWPKWKEAIQTR